MSSFYDAHTHFNKNKNAIYVLSLDEIQKINIDDSLDYPFAIGLHPWEIKNTNDKEALVRIEKLSTHPNCVTIGETGIDRIEVERTPLSDQMRIFNWHIQLAQKRSLPLTIHCVRAYNEIYRELSSQKFQQSIIFHDFNGNQQIVKMFEKFNVFYSLGDKLFRPKSKGFQLISQDFELIKNAILLETDDSNRNIESYYQKLSEISGLQIGQLINIIEENFKKAFHC